MISNNMKFFLNLVATILLTSLTAYSIAKMPKNNTASETIKVVKGKSGSWKLTDEAEAYVIHSCSHKRAKLLNFPLNGVCNGGLWVRPIFKTALEKLEYSLYRQRGVYSDDFDGADFLVAILNQSRPIIEFNGLQYELEGLAEYVKADYNASLKRENDEVFNERLEVVGPVLGGLLFICIVYLIIRAAIRKAPDVARCVTSGVQKTIDEANKRKVRSVVVDEAIRQTTRTAIASASESEKAVLRNQIKHALDSGNHDTAKALMGVLQKMEGD